MRIGAFLMEKLMLICCFLCENVLLTMHHLLDMLRPDQASGSGWVFWAFRYLLCFYPARILRFALDDGVYIHLILLWVTYMIDLYYLPHAEACRSIRVLLGDLGFSLLIVLLSGPDPSLRSG